MAYSIQGRKNVMPAWCFILLNMLISCFLMLKIMIINNIIFFFKHLKTLDYLESRCFQREEKHHIVFCRGVWLEDVLLY